MKIKICDKNAEKLRTLIDETNGDALTYTYRYTDLLTLVAATTNQLAGLMYKKDWSGVRCVSISGARVATAYSYTRVATRLEITYCRSGWFLTDCAKTTVGYSGGGQDDLFLRQHHFDAATKFLLESHNIKVIRDKPIFVPVLSVVQAA